MYADSLTQVLQGRVGAGFHGDEPLVGARGAGAGVGGGEGRDLRMCDLFFL